MTRYTVVWHQFALDELLRLWLSSSDRQSITNAADAIDRELSRSASKKGVLVDDDIRELFVVPLRVIFTVSEPDRLVTIAAVALI
jgi:hypothetical protein